jgi:hypothetical protein
VCSCGSPARDVRWSKTAAANPSVATWVCPLRPTLEYPDRRRVCQPDRSGDVAAAECPQRRHRLRGGEAQVVARDAVRSPCPAQLTAFDRMDRPTECRLELPLPHLGPIGQAECFESAAVPATQGLTHAEEVLTRPIPDLVRVVPPRAGPDLRCG